MLAVRLAGIGGRAAGHATAAGTSFGAPVVVRLRFRISFGMTPGGYGTTSGVPRSSTGERGTAGGFARARALLASSPG